MPTYSSYKNSLREFLKLSISCAAVGAVHCSSFRAFLLSVSDSEVLLKVQLSVTLSSGCPCLPFRLSLDSLLYSSLLLSAANVINAALCISVLQTISFLFLSF